MSKTPIPASIGRAPDELVRMVTEDLAKRLNIPTENITVVAAIGQEFTAEAFRCQGIKERITRDVTPELISGFSIVLSAAGQRYEYHASEDSVIFCRRML